MINGIEIKMLSACEKVVKIWKSWYMKKNSKFPSQIYLKCWHRGISERFWTYSIELTINCDLKDKRSITKEIYDHYESMSFPWDKEMRTNLEFIILERFKPNERQLELETVSRR